MCTAYSDKEKNSIAVISAIIYLFESTKIDYYDIYWLKKLLDILQISCPSSFDT